MQVRGFVVLFAPFCRSPFYLFIYFPPLHFHFLFSYILLSPSIAPMGCDGGLHILGTSKAYTETAAEAGRAAAWKSAPLPGQQRLV